MKITCCCITCFIGQEVSQSSEQERLISHDKDASVSAPAEIQNRNVLSPTRSVRSESPESSGDASAKKAADILKRNRVSLGSQQPERKESVQKAVGILKKYRISTTKSQEAGGKPEEKSEPPLIDLKISIKIMVRSDIVKIFVVEATNVLPVLKEKNPEHDLSGEELLLVQVRTKILPTEFRSHSHKFEVYEGFTGAMKFANECLYTLTIPEFVNKQIRFRLYNVFKQKRDILLGEYILDIPSLGLEIESTTTNVLMQLHEPTCETVKPPELVDVRRLLSSSGTGSSGSTGGQPGIPPERSLKSTIRRSDVKVTSRKSLPIFSNIPEKEPVDGKQSPSLVSIEEQSKAVTKEMGPEGPFQHMIKGAHDRTEKLEGLSSATDDMAHEASAFSEMSTRLREKYQKKHSRKKLK